MKDYKNIYFLGIGGIGMSALARYYRSKNYKVLGYDRTPSPLCGKLQAEGCEIHYHDDSSLIPQDIENTLVIYTPAIPRDLGEFQYVMNKGYRVLKRSKMLGEIARNSDCLAIAGTHGKTSISTFLAHIIHSHNHGCNAFLGGISKNYNSNLLLGESSCLVAEADEFDRSFLQLFPKIALISSMDPDHLDIYGTQEAYQQAFKDFAKQVSEKLIIKLGIDIQKTDTQANILTYHYDNPQADFHAKNIYHDELGYYHFDLQHPQGLIKGLYLQVPGWLHVENAIAASSVALSYGLPEQAIREAVASFQGVCRRLEIHINTPKLTYIDDYAHHPRELASAISSIRSMYPCRKITGIFQPHLYSRTRDFAKGFAKALSGLDKVLLLDIYPARELPIPGVSSQIIFDSITCDKILLSKDKLMTTLEAENLDILVSFGAGDIDRFIPQIRNFLTNKLNSNSKN